MLYINDISSAEQEFQKIQSSLINNTRLSLEADICFAKQDFSSGFDLLDTITKKDADYYNNYMYQKLKNHNYEDAYNIARSFLHANSFHPSLEVMIINYELSKYLLDKKIKPARIGQLLKQSSSPAVKIACLILQENYPEAFKKILEHLKHDKSFVYELKYWPLFTKFKQSSEYMQLQKDFALYFNNLT